MSADGDRITFLATHMSDEYAVLVNGRIVGRVRRNPRRMDRCSSKTDWQFRADGKAAWFGSFETRKQATKDLLREVTHENKAIIRGEA